jgi:zinc/manganese transport system substrate-binding protein
MRTRMIIGLVALGLFLMGVLPGAGHAAPPRLNVVTTLPDYAFFARRIGGDLVTVQAIVRGDQDAHFIRPKPSFITMVKEADVLIATGLDLEMWLSTVVDKSGNTRVRSGQIGFVAASQGVPLREKPQTLSRIEGGLHIYGNPHYTNCPVRMKTAVRNIAIGLTKNRPESAEVFEKNRLALEEEINRRLYGEDLCRLLGSRALDKLALSGRLVEFVATKQYRGEPLSKHAGGWLAKMLPLRGKALVTYHKNWVYFLALFGMEEAGTVEPKPGIPPSPKHVAKIVTLMRERRITTILAANYFDEVKVRSIAENVGAVPVIVPLYVGGREGVDDYFKLVDFWVDSLVAVMGEAAD